MSAHRPDSHRDETLRELLTSPLDEQPRRGPSTILLVAGIVAAVTAAILIPVLVLGGGGDETEPEAGTAASTTTTTDVPGTPGYPSARSLAPAAAAGPGRIVMVGGVEGTPRVVVGSAIAETWTYSTTRNQWYEADPSGNPEARFGQAMAFDEQSGALVMFGGSTGPGRFCRVVRRCGLQEQADTWWFFPDTGTWNQAPGSGGPSARFGAAAAYDAQSDRIVLFGGSRTLDN